MNITFVSESGRVKGDALVLFTTSQRGKISSRTRKWLADNAPGADKAPALADFKPEAGKTCVLYAEKKNQAPRIILAGLGTRKEAGLLALRRAAWAAAGCLPASSVRKVLVSGRSLEGLFADLPRAAEEALVGFGLGVYAYPGKQEPEKKAPEELCLVSPKKQAKDLAAAVETARAVTSGLMLTLDLVNAPSNLATPQILARKARETAEELGLKIDVLDHGAVRELGMGLLGAVASASAEPPCFVVLEHAPKEQWNAPPLVLVGKGVTFDTGGISLKPSAGMEEMKSDMAGAAAVLGAMAAIARAGLPARVIGLMPLAENMPGGKAVKPGDVATSLSGLTVEIVNTDAEGRLLLADALAYAARLEPALVVDVATLTGACAVALGRSLAGVFSRDERLRKRLGDLGTLCGDRLWPMPLLDDYKDDMKSDVADMKNMGVRPGAAIHAALFLERFAPESAPWAHVDMAGPAFAQKPENGRPKGATGFGMRLLFELARDAAKDKK